MATVQFKLIDWERRDIAASTLERVWREEAGVIPEATEFSITSSSVGGDLPVHYDLSHPDPDRLRSIADHVVAELASIDGVFDVRDNLDEGFSELRLELEPHARTLQLTLDDFARQMRAGFFGVEALRVPRGREDVRVYVRLPGEERNSLVDVEKYMVRTPGGPEVALGQIASVGFDRSPSTIHRIDGRRAVTITADVTPSMRQADKWTIAWNGTFSRLLKPGIPTSATRSAGSANSRTRSMQPWPDRDSLR